MGEAAAGLIIAHQLDKAWLPGLRPLLDPAMTLVALSPEAAYEVPSDARVMLAVPVRAGNLTVPAAPPADWPRGLQWVHTISAGVDEYPSWLFAVPRVTCDRGTNSAVIAEFVLAGMLAFEKRFPGAWVTGRDQWRYGARLGRLEGKTLGLLGFGSIGAAIATRALAFGMTVLAHRRSGRPSATAGVRMVDFDTVLGAADHLVIAMPLTAATRRLVDAHALSKVKPNVHIVNIARGAILDHDALLAGLESGRIGAASLDVTDPEPLPDDHPLYRHPAVRISPHISWSGGDPAQAFAVFAENLRRFREGAELLHRVDPAAGY